MEKGNIGATAGASREVGHGVVRQRVGVSPLSLFGGVSQSLRPALLRATLRPT